jgi:outer membrane protein W
VNNLYIITKEKNEASKSNCDTIQLVLCGLFQRNVTVPNAETCGVCNNVNILSPHLTMRFHSDEHVESLRCLDSKTL